jgi:hypothetical protein
MWTWNNKLFPSPLPILPPSLTRTRTDAPSPPHKRLPPSNSPRREDHARGVDVCQRGDGALSSHPRSDSVKVHIRTQREECTLKDSRHVALAASPNAYPLLISTCKKARAQLQQARDDAPNAPLDTSAHHQHHGSDAILRSPRTEARALSPSRRPGAHSRTSVRHGAMRSSSSPPASPSCSPVDSIRLGRGTAKTHTRRLGGVKGVAGR